MMAKTPAATGKWSVVDDRMYNLQVWLLSWPFWVPLLTLILEYAVSNATKKDLAVNGI
jgi:hypothetical protein